MESEFMSGRASSSTLTSSNIFYFVNLDISASIWVFYIVTTIQRGIFNMVGFQSTERMDLYSREPYIAHQGMGAMIVFVLVGLWVARGHLKEVFKTAFQNDSQTHPERFPNDHRTNWERSLNDPMIQTLDDPWMSSERSQTSGDDF